MTPIALATIESHLNRSFDERLSLRFENGESGRMSLFDRSVEEPNILDNAFRRKLAPRSLTPFFLRILPSKSCASITHHTRTVQRTVSQPHPCLQSPLATVLLETKSLHGRSGAQEEAPRVRL